MNTPLPGLEILAHLFSGKEQMHELLDEWLMAWLATKNYDGADVLIVQQHFALHAFLQQVIRLAELH